MNFLIIGEECNNTHRLKELLEITFPKLAVTVSKLEYYKLYLIYEWDLVIVLPISEHIDLQAYSKPVLYIVDSENNKIDYAKLIQNGVRGIINNDAPLDILRTGIIFVKDGGFFLDPKITKNIDSVLLNPKKTINPFKLTKRQQEILLLIAQGLTTDEIAKKLNIKRTTVLYHKRTIVTRTNSKTIPEVIAKGIKNGWLYDI